MNNKSVPVISVIVAVFNGVKTLQKCIDSVNEQTYPNRELIILDGGSLDGTEELLKKNNNKIKYWISEPDGGICNAWNKGLLHAKGDWICFLGADDYFWNSNVLEQVAKKLLNIPSGINIAYGQVMMVNERDENLYVKGDQWHIMKKCFMQFMCISHQGVMHRRSLFESNGKFDESFSIAGDYELLLRELKAGEAIYIPDMIISGMRQGGLSSAPRNSINVMREFRRAQKMHGYYYPGLYWIMAMTRVYIRLLLWNLFGEKITRNILDKGRWIEGLPPYWTRT